MAYPKRLNFGKKWFVKSRLRDARSESTRTCHRRETGVGLRNLWRLLPGAAGIAIVAFAESNATARSLADKHKYEVDPNQELIALGADWRRAPSGAAACFTKPAE